MIYLIVHVGGISQKEIEDFDDIFFYSPFLCYLGPNHLLKRTPSYSMDPRLFQLHRDHLQQDLLYHSILIVYLS
jgi:hypothetical protein